MPLTSAVTLSPEAKTVLGAIDHAILSPTATDQETRAGVEAVRDLPIASVCVRPHAVSMAAEICRGGPVGVCTVAGFPHGGQLPEAKAHEAKLALRDGATEIDMVVNAGKVLSCDWDYVRRDIGEVLAVVRSSGAVLKVIFETDYLTEDFHKIRLCEICGELAVDYVKTSTGFGFVRGRSGGYDQAGATDHDLALMRAHCPPSVGVKASGGIRDAARARRVLALGCTRIGTSSTHAIYKELLAEGTPSAGDELSPEK